MPMGPTVDLFGGFILEHVESLRETTSKGGSTGKRDFKLAVSYINLIFQISISIRINRFSGSNMNPI